MSDQIIEHEYGDDAYTNKRYEHLTDLQRAVVDAIVDRRGGTYTTQEIGDIAQCSPSTVTYAEQNFPHASEQRRSTMRQPVADGEGHYEVRLAETDAFKMVRMLPDELARKLYDQIRQQGP